jgi:hypothetical protein
VSEPDYRVIEDPKNLKRLRKFMAMDPRDAQHAALFLKIRAALGVPPNAVAIHVSMWEESARVEWHMQLPPLDEEPPAKPARRRTTKGHLNRGELEALVEEPSAKPAPRRAPRRKKAGE